MWNKNCGRCQNQAQINRFVPAYGGTPPLTVLAPSSLEQNTAGQNKTLSICYYVVF